jgi:hypothetical protein
MATFLIVGGGASGVTAALSVKHLNPAAKVVLHEKRARLGGMADSRAGPNGKQYNYGVQGVHETFVYTLKLIQHAQSMDASIPDPIDANLSAQFVTKDGIWNTSGTGSVKFQKQHIMDFKELCEEATWAPDVYSLLSITDACDDNDIHKPFVDNAVVPTLALFFGTGQQQSGVPAGIAAQVFSPNTPVQIFDINEKTFIATRNNMKALPPLGPVYRALHRFLTARGITVELNSTSVPDFDQFDRVIICTQAEDAARLLPANHKARPVLQSAKYYDDITITHTDTKHMLKTFGATDEFNYYMHHGDTMGFALHKYQRLPSPIYQTIFLQTQTVPNDAIDKKQILAQDDWRQVACSVDHIEKCVLKLRAVQGPHIFFAGSYTFVNSHEIAIMSGIRAAQMAVGTSAFPNGVFGQPNAAYIQFASL